MFTSRPQGYQRARLSPFKIALTGLIGSGKTALLEDLRGDNISILSADDVVRDLYCDQAIWGQVKSIIPGMFEFPHCGSRARQHIAEHIFENSALRKELENFIHPFVQLRLKDFFKSSAAAKDWLAVAEVPLVFEAGFQKNFDAVVFLELDQSERFKGLEIYRSLSLKDVQKIDQLRLPEKNLASKSDYVLKDYILKNSKQRQEMINNMFQALGINL